VFVVVATTTTTTTGVMEFHVVVDPTSSLGRRRRIQNYPSPDQFPIFTSLSQAANAVATLRQQQQQQQQQPVTVYIHTHDDSNNNNNNNNNAWAISEPILLNASHSHTVWKSASKISMARIHGGYRLDARDFQRVGKHIVTMILPKDISLIGSRLQSGGLNECAHDHAIKIIWNGSMLTLARFPNANRNQPSWYRIRNVTSPNSFTYYYDDEESDEDASVEDEEENQNNRLQQQKHTRIRFSKDLWLHGYWQSDWADNYVQVQSITTKKRTSHHHHTDSNNGTVVLHDDDNGEKEDVIHIDTNTSHVLYNLSNDARFYVLNSLHLLDAPGEYFLDHANRKLYIYPPSSFNDDDDNPPPEVYISQASHLIVAENVTDVHFENIHFDISQGSALVFNHSTHVSITNASITNVGGSYAIWWDNVTHSTIDNVHITKLACSGIGWMRSGNRRTLQSSYNRIQHNRIHDYARWKRTYMAAIHYDDACGHVIVGNEIYDAPHQGIAGHGNNIVIRSNHLHDLCYETSDGGAVYFGRTFADRGNVIVNNHFQRIRRTDVYYANQKNHSSSKIIIKGYAHVQAIYLDDQMSGFNITGNWIVDSDTGILIGGGRDHSMVRNRFVNVDIPIFWDKRGIFNTAPCEPHGAFQAELEKYHFQQPPWSIRYPELVSTFQNNPCAPANNAIQDLQFCWSNHPNASSPSSSSSWILTPSTSLEELVLWNNSFSNIAQNDSLCNHHYHYSLDTSEGTFSVAGKALEKMILNEGLEIQ
jgi:hypothetical protein